MKKLLILSLISLGCILNVQKVKADWDYWGIKYNIYGLSDKEKVGTYIYTINSHTGASTLRGHHCNEPYEKGVDGWVCLNGSNHYVDKKSGKLIFETADNTFKAYDEASNSFIDGYSGLWSDSYSSVYERPSIRIDSNGNKIMEISGSKMLEEKTNGELHIGENSLVTKEENDQQQLWGQNSSGQKIPININGSKLLIDGVEVTAGGNNAQINTNKTNIKNLGDGVAGSTALTAALTALPQTSKESKLSCGVGSGTYSSRYAVGFGCASKVNERVDVNAGGSYVFGGSKSYGEGTLDSGIIKAGFVFKLGKLNKPTQISMREKKELKEEISILKENNQNILAQNQALLARLDRLEKIALKEIKSKTF